jgi:hypothetical protein
MNLQEQEEADFNWGRQTELQNAFELGRMERGNNVDVMPEVRRLNALGFWVEVDRMDICCPYTDAFIRYETIIVGVSSTLAALNEDEQTFAPEFDGT